MRKAAESEGSGVWPFGGTGDVGDLVDVEGAALLRRVDVIVATRLDARFCARLETRQPTRRQIGHPFANRTLPCGGGGTSDVSAARNHVVDHALQTEPLAVMRRINLLDAISFELGNFFGDDHAPATAEHLDTLAATRTQQIDEITEVFVVAALIAGYGDAVGVFVQCGGSDFFDRAVVAEVDHLDAARLQDAPHDVDRRVVAVEQGSSGDETQAPASG
ncbi:hypothetical protein R70199_04831 [Paraburkholderia domus]|nr:hypothetical protein R70199_04831 [Paraburkholderia domus]